MKKEEFFEKLTNVLVSVINEEYPDINISVNENTKLLEEYPIDSIFGIEVLSLIEEEFNISIDDEDLNLKLLVDIEKLYKYVSARITG